MSMSSPGQHRDLAVPPSAVDGVLRKAAYWSLLLFVFSIPWQVAIEIDQIGTISRLFGFVTVGLAVLAIAFEGRRHRLLDAHILLIAFTAWTACGLMWTLYPSDTRAAVATFVQLTAMVLLVWEFGDGQPKIYGLIRAFVAGAAVTAGSVVYQYLTLGEGASRYTGSGAHPNDVAFVLCLAIPLAWYLSARVGSGYERLLERAYIPFALFAIVLTASRSAIVIAALALLIIPLSYSALSGRWRVALIVVGAGLLVLVPSLLPERQVERLSTITTEIEGGGLGSRADIWKAALEVFNEHPVRGTGVGASRRLIASIYGEAQGAHNTFLSVAVETGAVGLALFLLVLYAFFRRTTRLRGLERTLIVVIGLALAVGLLPRHWEDEKALWVVLALILAMSHHVGAPAADVSLQAVRREKLTHRDPVGTAAQTEASWPIAARSDS